jgi:hypothetical protein
MENSISSLLPDWENVGAGLERQAGVVAFEFRFFGGTLPAAGLDGLIRPQNGATARIEPAKVGYER